MQATDLYLPLKTAHITLVVLSVTLFTARGLGVLAAAGWPMVAAVRRASVVIDSLLLASGATLWWLLGLHPLHQPWLGTKLVLLLVYIVLGVFALRRARTTRARALFFVAALAVVAFMASIALAHDSRGLFLHGLP